MEPVFQPASIPITSFGSMSGDSVYRTLKRTVFRSGVAEQCISPCPDAVYPRDLPSRLSSPRAEPTLASSVDASSFS